MQRRQSIKVLGRHMQRRQSIKVLGRHVRLVLEEQLGYFDVTATSGLMERGVFCPCRI